VSGRGEVSVFERLVALEHHRRRLVARRRKLPLGHRGFGVAGRRHGRVAPDRLAGDPFRQRGGRGFDVFRLDVGLVGVLRRVLALAGQAHRIAVKNVVHVHHDDVAAVAEPVRPDPQDARAAIPVGFRRLRHPPTPRKCGRGEVVAPVVDQRGGHHGPARPVGPVVRRRFGPSRGEPRFRAPWRATVPGDGGRARRERPCRRVGAPGTGRAGARSRSGRGRTPSPRTRAGWKAMAAP